MPKFELGQAVRIVHGDGEPFCGRVAEIHDPGPTFYRVEDEYKGHTYAMTVEEGWLEPDEEPEAPGFTDRATCLIDSLKSLCFHIGGTYVAGMVEEAERAARQGRVVKYE